MPKVDTMILSLFAGPGGACLGIKDATGVDPIGIERDPNAIATRDAAGLVTIEADLRNWSPCQLDTGIDGLWASPPCPAFSTAGKREGHDDLEHLCWIAARPDTWPHPVTFTPWNHPDSGLIVNSLRWVAHHRPRWIVFEQVPAVLPVWQATCIGLEGFGYSTWAGLFNAANVGVPQTRVRAFLIAALDRHVGPPEPTHAKDPQPALFGKALRPWVSMADALGWGGRVGFPRRDDTGTSPDGYRERDWFDTDGPAPSVTEKARSWTLDTRRDQRPDGTTQTVTTDRPAPTVTGEAGGQWVLTRPHFGKGTVRCTVDELAVLQGFPAGYPWQGSRTAQFQQVGNAVPPPVARAIVETLA